MAVIQWCIATLGNILDLEVFDGIPQTILFENDVYVKCQCICREIDIFFAWLSIHTLYSVFENLYENSSAI